MPDNSNYGGDMYSDAGPAAPAAPAEAAPEKPKAGHETALVPKSLCPGMSPGDEFVVKVVRVHDDQYELEYVPGPAGGGEASKAEVPEGMGAMME